MWAVDSSVRLIEEFAEQYYCNESLYQSFAYFLLIHHNKALTFPYKPWGLFRATLSYIVYKTNLDRLNNMLFTSYRNEAAVVRVSCNMT